MCTLILSCTLYNIFCHGLEGENKSINLHSDFDSDAPENVGCSSCGYFKWLLEGFEL